MDGKIITIDPEISGGTPVFSGTRVPIKNLFDYLETGETVASFLDDFESVKMEQVQKLLSLSYSLVQQSALLLNENFA